MRWGLFFFGLALMGADRELRLVTLDPAHFHAAQLNSGPLAGFSRDAFVYAPVGKDLAAYFNFISNLKARSSAPDHWRYHVYSGDDFFERMLKERRGDVVMLAGRNAKTIDYMGRLVEQGLHVLADKPWIIDAAKFPDLERALESADRRGLVLYDAMTQRFDIAYLLQREFVNDREIFGQPITGSDSQPAVEMASSHFLLKRFNGVVNLRPAAYFDIRQQGEAFADVGTHVVDLAHWTLFPDQALDYQKDIRIRTARRWPTVLSIDQFRQVTGEREYPDYLTSDIKDGKLQYFANNSVLYTVRGHHVKLDVTWEYESPSGSSDSMLAVYRGARAEVMARQSAAEKYVPEVYIAPKPEHRAAVIAALDRKLAQLAPRYPGLKWVEEQGWVRIVIPQQLRIPDIQYFLLLAERFAGYVRNPATLPKWEKANMLAKYWVTTQGVRAARDSQ